VAACFHTHNVTCDNCRPYTAPVAPPIQIIEYGKGPPPAIIVDGGMKEVIQRLDAIIEKLDKLIPQRKRKK
jgi:hypothetical protein